MLLLNRGGQAQGLLRHIGLPNTVASFRTWRGFQAPIAQPPKPDKRREWDSNPRWSFPHTRFPSVLLKPLGHLSKGLADFKDVLSECTTSKLKYSRNQFGLWKDQTPPDSPASPSAAAPHPTPPSRHHSRPVWRAICGSGPPLREDCRAGDDASQQRLESVPGKKTGADRSPLSTGLPTPREPRNSVPS